MIYLFEDHHALKLEPLTLTRASFELRCGALTHLERVRQAIGRKPLALVVRPELEEVVADSYPNLPVNPGKIESGLWLSGSALWDAGGIHAVETSSQPVTQDNVLLGWQLSARDGAAFMKHLLSGQAGDVMGGEESTLPRLMHLWDHIQKSGAILHQDFDALYSQRHTQVFPKGVEVIGDHGIYIGSNVHIDPYVLIDARNGVVIIEDDSHIGSHSVVAGPSYLGKGTRVQPHSYLRAVNLGPECRVAGEMKAVIMQGYGNKPHYGFLGHSYLGEWVNLGAGTTTGHTKSTYGQVATWVNGREIHTGLAEVGTFMGDYATTAVGTMLDPGTRLGLAAQIHGASPPPKMVPDFAWGEGGGGSYDLDRCLDAMDRAKGRHGLFLSEAEKELITLRHKQSSAA